MTEPTIKVLVAPNSLKGSMSAFEFADIVAQAFARVSSRFEVRCVPVADGGDFTGEVLQRAYNAFPVEVVVKDPLGRPVSSKYYKSETTAIIEMADASGIKLLKPDELNPMIASSYGTGELIAAAMKDGCTNILLGVGGSATVDGGAGMMQALGFTYYNDKGIPVEGNGKNLVQIVSVTKARWPAMASVKIITDVENPLLGDYGAAAVFGPQKGADPFQVKQLEEGLSNWCSLLEKESGRQLSDIEGSGAAGGVTIPLLAWADAEIVPGAKFILNAVDFDNHVEWADIIITGEGRIDRQTLANKAPKAVADAAGKVGKPVIGVGGSVDPHALQIFNAGAFSFLNGPISLADAMKNAHQHLDSFSEELAKLFLVSFKK